MSRERDNGRRGRIYGIGLPMMLVIYVVLCLLTMSVLSLLTANRAEKIEEESLVSFNEQNDAENQAEVRIAEYNRELQKDPDSAPERQEFTVPVSSEKELYVTLEKAGDGEDVHYQVTEWRTAVSHERAEQSLHGINIGK